VWEWPVDPRQEKRMNVKVNFLAETVAGGGYFCYLADQADNSVKDPFPAPFPHGPGIDPLSARRSLWCITQLPHLRT
jgi:hypothetical protein